MALQADALADLILLTLNDLGRGKWTDMASDLQDHVAMNSIIKKRKFRAGKGIQFNAQFRYSDAAKNTGLYAVDNVNVEDTMVQGNVPWRHTTTNYAFDRREAAMNSGAAEIVDEIKTRRNAALGSLAELMEINFWGAPGSTTDDKPFGIDYWVVKSATTGFNGGNHATFTAGPANIDSDTYTRWRNWTYEYTAVTKTDLIRGWREAATKTKFKTPVPHPSYNTGSRYGYYTNYDVLGVLEEELEAQNDNLGNDVASKDGKVMFRQTPVTWVPYLDGDSQDPVYGIDWGVFVPVFLRGEWMNENGPRQSPKQHAVQEVHIDLSYNFVCYDRRKLFILNKAA